MNRPPRSLKEQLLDGKTVAYSLLQGFIVLAVVLAVFVVAIRGGHGELDARALSFTTLIVANLGLILTNRSWSRVILSTLRTPNAALWWVVGGALFLLGLVLYVPFLRDLFRFDRLHLFDLGICLSAGIVSILWFEAFKMFRRE